MQSQIKHPPFSFPSCPGCGREPRHLFDARTGTFFGPARGGHFMACSCGDGAKFPTFAAALSAWCGARNLDPNANRNVRALRRPGTPVFRVGENKPC